MTRRILDQQPARYFRASSAMAAAAPETAPASTSLMDSLPSRMFSTAFGVTVRTRDDDASDFREDDANASKEKYYTIIKTNLLIPGDGEPLKDASLVIENKIIAWVGPQADLPKQYTAAPHRFFEMPYLMPGLWEVHSHFGGESADEGESSYVALVSLHPASAGARLSKGCWEALQRGYTSLRDVAGYGCEVAKAIDDGTIVGPNVYSSGAGLSQLAGHGDVHDLPAGDVINNLGVKNVQAGHWGSGPVLVIDGVDECRRGVRLQIRRGARCIKVMASGGVMSRDDNPLYAQFSREELETIVEEANRQGRSVAAHVHGKPGILAAVKAGVTTVEHVSFADQECIDLIKEKGTIYVATRFIVDMLIQTGGKGLSKPQWEKAKLCATNHETAYKTAIKNGVTFALGTDTPPGFNCAVELEYAVKCGMSNLEAIKAATANGPLTIGVQAPKTGQLKAGYEADILGLIENPVENVRILQKKDNIKYVFKGGKLFKGPGVGPWGEDYVFE
ncbi:amidohydrolase [Truncatella angustata]|uniref:Amidohydrolase n=1 Tax=Truncatella angustata TaxID=152316 RepID=A0A9P8UX99_9PEZI|nr:amidohydrolase [Truncatella angustata]KAH6659917.1 amidohydrolase [Truncatella angustata]